MSVAVPAGRARISLLGLVFLIVASVGWGLNFPIMKHLLTEWPPLSSRGLCGIVGALALALIALARRQPLRVPPRMWLRLTLVSLLSIGGWAACALAGAVCVGLGTVLTKHFPLAMPPLSLAAWQIGLG